MEAHVPPECWYLPTRLQHSEVSPKFLCPHTGLQHSVITHPHQENLKFYNKPHNYTTYLVLLGWLNQGMMDWTCSSDGGTKMLTIFWLEHTVKHPLGKAKVMEE
jgi:hypothetical protein